MYADTFARSKWPYHPHPMGVGLAYLLAAMLYASDSSDAALVWLQRPGDGKAADETTILRLFAGLHLMRIPYETTVLNFRWLLEKDELATGS